MKYLIVARGLNEPDNNTPSDEIWVRVIECEPKDLEQREKILELALSKDYEYGVELEHIELGVIEKGWRKATEIW